MFATRYYTTFTGQTTGDQFEINLKNKDFVGDAKRIDYYSTSPLSISHQGGRDSEYNSIVGSSAEFSFLALERYQYTALNNILLNNSFTDNLGDWSQYDVGESFYWNAGGSAVVDFYTSVEHEYIPAFGSGWTGSTGWFIDVDPSVTIPGSSLKLLQYNGFTGFAHTGTTSFNYSINVNSADILATIQIQISFYKSGVLLGYGDDTFVYTGLAFNPYTGTLSATIHDIPDRIRVTVFNLSSNPANITINYLTGGTSYNQWRGTSKKLLQQFDSDLLPQTYTLNYDVTYQSGTTNNLYVIGRDSSDSVLFDTLVSSHGAGSFTGTTTIDGTDVNDISFYIIGQSGLTQTAKINSIQLGTVADYNLSPQEEFEDLLESNYREWILEVKKNGSLYWIGYLKPENLSMSFIFPSFMISIEAVDGLADLKNFYYPESASTASNVSIIQSVKTALAEMNQDFGLDISSQVNFKELIGGVTGNTLQNIYINPIRFSNVKNGRPQQSTCHAAIEALLSSFQARLIQDAGRWLIYQRVENNSPLKTFDFDTLAASSTITNNRLLDFSSEKTLFGSDNLSKIRPYKYVDVTLRDKYSGENFLFNSSFDSNISGWNNINYNTFEWTTQVHSPRSSGGTLHVEGLTLYTAYSFESDAFAYVATTADTTHLSFDLYVAGAANTGTTNMTLKFQYLDADTDDLVFESPTFIMRGYWQHFHHATNFAFSGNLKVRIIQKLGLVSGSGLLFIDSFFDNFNLVAQYENSTVFDQYITANAYNSSAIETFEEELFFADTLTRNEAATLKYNVSTGITSTWSNYDETNFGKSLLDLYSTEVLNQNRRFRDYVRFSWLAPQDISLSNIISLYGNQYLIIGLEKDLLQGNFKLELVEYLTGYTTDISFVRGNYNTTDGQSTGGGTSSSGGINSGGGTGTVNAENGLTKIANDIRLGGVLDSDTTINTATGARLKFANFPIEYSNDLSTNYNLRSLVDAGYVTGQTAGKLSIIAFNTYSAITKSDINNHLLINTFNSYTASTTTNGLTGTTNGLSVTGKKVKLGGTLTGNTTINHSAGSVLLHLDNTTKRIGIATNSPGARLAVVGTGTTSGQILKLTDSAGTERFSLQDDGFAVFTANRSNGNFRVIGLTSVIAQNAGQFEVISTVAGSSNNLLLSNWQTYANTNKSGLGFVLRNGAGSLTPSAAIKSSIGYGSTANLEFYTGSGTGTTSHIYIGKFTDGKTLLLGGSDSTTANANTRLDIRGIGTTTNTAFRIADSANTERLTVLDNGKTNITTQGDDVDGFSYGSLAGRRISMNINSTTATMYIQGWSSASTPAWSFGLKSSAAMYVVSNQTQGTFIRNDAGDHLATNVLQLVTGSVNNTLQATNSTQRNVLNSSIKFLNGANSSVIKFIDYSGQVVNNGYTNVANTLIDLRPTLNITGSSSSTTYTAFKYNPTKTSAVNTIEIAYQNTSGFNVDSSKVNVTGATTQHNYNPAGWSGATTIRWYATGTSFWTGLKGGVDGRRALVMNTSNYDLTFKNEDTNSTAINRFALQGDTSVVKNGVKEFIYDGISLRWRVFI